MAKRIFLCHDHERQHTSVEYTVTDSHLDTSHPTARRTVSRVALTTREAATYLGLATSTLNKWRCDGGGPHFLKLGRAVRYHQDDLDRFLEARMFRSTNEI